MKFILKAMIVSGVLISISGCAPKVISIKSPMNNLENKQCFSFPSKQALKNSPIYKQRLYMQTENALKLNNINVIYGDSSKCKNYILTDWIVNSSQSTMIIPGSRTTNTYGNVYGNSFNANSTTITMPTIAYNLTSYHGAYLVEVGSINNDNSLSLSWKGSQSGGTSRTSTYDAQRVADSFQPLVNNMIKKMLIENNMLIE